MKLTLGHTVITCRNCGTMTAIDNQSMEVLTEHTCPNCGMRMPDREVARMKLHLYLLWTQLYNAQRVVPPDLFDYDINLHPHYVDDVKKTEENGNREGG